MTKTTMQQDFESVHLQRIHDAQIKITTLRNDILIERAKIASGKEDPKILRGRAYIVLLERDRTIETFWTKDEILLDDEEILEADAIIVEVVNSIVISVYQRVGFFVMTPEKFLDCQNGEDLITSVESARFFQPTSIAGRPFWDFPS